MRSPIRLSLIAITAGLLAGCTAPSGPVEVTRFHDAGALNTIGEGNFFVDSAPGLGDSLEMAPYKAAVASRLAALGYTESGRGDARYIAQVDVERYRLASNGRRSPVSVGVGGSTGGYGSGVGLGIGINLGGSGERVGTDLSVVMREASSQQSVWEGRASFQVSPKSDLADAAANAAVMTDALFAQFPGNSGETVEVSVD